MAAATWFCGSNGVNHSSAFETTAFSYVYVHRFWEGDMAARDTDKVRLPINRQRHNR